MSHYKQSYKLKQIKENMIVDRYEWVSSIESNARTYASSFKAVFERANGLRLHDSNGREILDCLCCAGALPLGHNHPEVREAVVKYASGDFMQQGLDLTTPMKFEFLKELYGLLPEEFAQTAKIQFCGPSGSDAVEAALKLVRFAKQRQSVISFHGGYHGMTAAALAATGNLSVKPVSVGTAFGIYFAPFPYRFRCPFGTDGGNTDVLAMNYLRTILTDPESGISKPAAVLVEVIQGEGGCIPAPDAWLKSLRELTYELDIPLIVDEVQTGLGRTGDIFAFQRSGIVPDVLILSKALGGGYPLSVVLYNAALDKWTKGMHAGTFRGNQIAMAAGCATMKIIQRDRLAENAREVGNLVLSGLQCLKQRYPVIGDIRGRGLMIGVEIVGSQNVQNSLELNGLLAGKIKSAAFEKGLMLETGGRHGAVLRLLPPINLSAADAKEILIRLDAALAVSIGIEPESLDA